MRVMDPLSACFRVCVSVCVCEREKKISGYGRCMYNMHKLKRIKVNKQHTHTHTHTNAYLKIYRNTHTDGQSLS